jgi:hypothetical protein
MPKAAKETKCKPRAKTFEDVFVAKPEHEHCKQSNGALPGGAATYSWAC